MSDMSGAELRVQLTGLGLTPVWFADRLGINERTVLRWFHLDRIPERAVEELGRVVELTSAEMRSLVVQARSGVIRTRRIDGDGRDAGGVQFLNTLPASWHRALTFRVLEYVRDTGADVTVGYV